MIKTDIPIIVEGKYDKIKLSSFIDGIIITTDGFGIFKNKEKVNQIKKLGQEKGIIVLTDSDSAGSIIRSYLKNIIGEDKIYNVFIPEIFGKEKRKANPSAEGLLGVEGINKELIIEAFERFVPQVVEKSKNKICTDDIDTPFLMQCGLTGCQDSKKRRLFLLKKLGIPGAISSGTLKKVLSKITTKEEILKILEEYTKTS